MYAARRKGLRHLPPRFGSVLIGLLDQGASSLWSLAQVVIAASWLEPDGLGVVSLGIAATTLTVNVARSAALEVLFVERQSPDAVGGANQRGASFGLCLAVGALASLLLGAGALLMPLGPTLTQGLLITAIFLIPACILDASRILAAHDGREASALLVDLSYLGFLGLGVAVFTAWREVSPGQVLLLFGFSSLVAASFGVALVTTKPLWPNRGTSWRLRASLTAEGALLQMSSQGIYFVVAGVGGVEAAGIWRVAQAVLGPLTALALGVRTILMPSLKRQYEASARSLRQHVVALGVALSSTTMICGAAILGILLQHGDDWFGEVWASASTLSLLLLLNTSCNAWAVAARSGLRFAGDTRRSLVAQTFATVLTLFGVGFGLRWGGYYEAGVALLSSSIIVSAAWLFFAFRAGDQPRRVQAIA